MLLPVPDQSGGYRRCTTAGHAGKRQSRPRAAAGAAADRPAAAASGTRAVECGVAGPVADTVASSARDQISGWPDAGVCPATPAVVNSAAASGLRRAATRSTSVRIASRCG